MNSLHEPLCLYVDRVMAPLRRLGWWITLVEQGEDYLVLYANHLRVENQCFAVATPRGGGACLLDYKLWLRSCAQVLYACLREVLRQEIEGAALRLAAGTSSIWPLAPPHAQNRSA
jgi:hypothetical protein